MHPVLADSARSDHGEVAPAVCDQVDTCACAAPAQPAAASIWRNRDFLILWLGQTVSGLGSEVSGLALPLLVLALTHSPAQAGLIGGIRGLPFAVLALPVGALVDRWDRKRVMVASDLIRALALASLPAACWIGALTLLQLYVVAIAEGTIFVFYTLAQSACLPRIVDRQQLPAALSATQAGAAATSIAGRSLGGLLYAVGTAVPFAVDAVSYLASVLSLGLIRRELQDRRPGTPRRLRAEMAQGLSWLWRHPRIRFLALLSAGLNLPCFGYGLILIVQAQRLHASSSAIGLVMATGGMGSIAGALVAGPLLQRIGFSRLLLASTWIWVLGWPLSKVAPHILVLGMANMLSWTIVPIYNVTQSNYLMAHIPEQLLGRVNAVFRLIAYGGGPLGIALTGALLQAYGPMTTMLVLWAPQLLVAVWASSAARFGREDDERRP
jgi:predicted MFS family arabinose efflux permease